VVSAVHTLDFSPHLLGDLEVRADDEGLLGAQKERAERNDHRLARASGHDDEESRPRTRGKKVLVHLQQRQLLRFAVSETLGQGLTLVVRSLLSYKAWWQLALSREYSLGDKKVSWKRNDSTSTVYGNDTEYKYY